MRPAIWSKETEEQERWPILSTFLTEFGACAVGHRHG